MAQHDGGAPPRLAVLLLVCAAAFPLGDVVGGAGQLLALAGAVAAAAALACGPLWAGPRLSRSARWAVALALAYAAHAALVGVGYLAFTTWTKLCGPLALFALAAGGGPQTRRQLAGALTAATLAACVLGCVQLAFPAPMPESWVDPERYHRVKLRLVGPLANPNLFGAYLATVLPVHAAAYVCGGFTGARAVAEGAAAALSGALLLLTFSRGGWLAAGLGLAALGALAAWARLPVARGRLGALCAAAAIACAAAGPAVVERLRVSGDSAELGVAQRGALYRGVLDAIAARPLAGWGLGSFQTAFPRFRRAGGYFPREAHSTWLHLAFETGVPGALGFALVVLSVLGAGARGARDERDALLAGGVAGALGACGAGMFVATVAYMQLDVAMWTVLALAVPAAGEGTRWPARALAIGLAVGGVLWAAVAVVDPLTRGEAGGRERARLEDAVRWMPFRSELWHDLGETCEMAGDLAAADAAYSSGLARDPLQGRFLLSRARVRAKLRRVPDALADLDRALADDPYSEEVLVMRGALLVALGRDADARADLERALATNVQYHRLNPGTFQRAARFLADLYAKAGRSADAQAMAEKAAELGREAHR